MPQGESPCRSRAQAMVKLSGPFRRFSHTRINGNASTIHFPLKAERAISMANGKRKIPTIDELKAQAKALRRSLEREGKPVSHSRALELVAHQYGYGDWNTIYAAAGNQPPTCPVAIGERVSGQYLGRPFDGEVIGVQVLGAQERYRITLHFDIPVDVVTFDSFSAFRHRVNCVIDRHGVTAERTSNGNPHLKLAL